MVHIDTQVLSGTEWFDFISHITELDGIVSYGTENGMPLSAFTKCTKWYSMRQYRNLSSVCCGLPYGLPGGTSNKRKEALFLTRIRARTAVTDFAVSAQPVSQHLFRGTNMMDAGIRASQLFQRSLSKLTL